MPDEKRAPKKAEKVKLDDMTPQRKDKDVKGGPITKTFTANLKISDNTTGGSTQ